MPAYLERSRSGNGGHVWIFFSAPVPATSARQLGIRLLKETMVLRAEMDLASYDRFFPSQDFLPRAGFGNLIALPLQKKCRALGNTEFLNPEQPELRPWADQWTFLSEVKRLGPSQVEALLEKIPPDTLFLVFPLSFKGKLVQYVGRALRSHEDKSSVRVYDYVDTQVLILRKMFAKRQKTYRSLRFTPEDPQTNESSKKTFDTVEMSGGLFGSGS